MRAILCDHEYQGNPQGSRLLQGPRVQDWNEVQYFDNSAGNLESHYHVLRQRGHYIYIYIENRENVDSVSRATDLECNEVQCLFRDFLHI